MERVKKNQSAKQVPFTLNPLSSQTEQTFVDVYVLRIGKGTAPGQCKLHTKRYCPYNVTPFALLF